MSEEAMVKVAIRDEEGEVETLWAFPLGDNRYRLDNSPFFAYRVSWHDVVEALPAADGLLEFVRVVEKSGHRTVRVKFTDGDDDRRTAILARVNQLGCTFEGATPKYLAVDVPPEVELKQVAGELTAANADWEYADPPYEDLFAADA